MVGGISGCSGILLYDTEKEDYNAVYGYYDKNNNIIQEKGSLDELKKRQKETYKPFQNNEKNETKTVFGLFFAMVFAVIALFLFAPLTIAKPTEKEYLLGIEVAKAIWYGDKEITDERE